MNKCSFLLSVLVSAASTITFAQKSFWNSPAAYLGQKPPGNTPVKFAPGIINDSPFFSMDRCAFSADGKEFYYVRNNTWFSGKESSIRVCTYDGAKWTGPAELTQHYYAPVFSMDSNTLYIIGGGAGVVLQMHRQGTGWSQPETYIKRHYGLYDFMPTKSGNIYAASNINGPINDFTCYDICVMAASATDTFIRTLGKPLNTPGFDGDFFVAPDESYIVISAKEHPDYECELYISYHKKDNNWTNPKSLGPEINNGLAHRWGEYVTPDGKYLIYSYGHGPQDCALYWVRFDNLLENLKHTNFDPYVKDSIPPQSATAGKHFILQIPSGTFVDDDGNNTLAYSATLSNGDPLPAWLTFNAGKKIISGRPNAAGTYNITITATDTAKATATSTFKLTVTGP